MNRIEELEHKINLLEERLDELENSQLSLIKRKIDCHKQEGERNKNLTLYLIGLIAVTMAGLTFQNGQISYSLKSENLSSLVEVLGILGFTGLSIGAVNQIRRKE